MSNLFTTVSSSVHSAGTWLINGEERKEEGHVKNDAQLMGDDITPRDRGSILFWGGGEMSLVETH